MIAINYRTTAKKLGKILDVNCHPEMADILQVNLTRANFEVISARNGAEGLRKASSEQPDVIAEFCNPIYVGLLAALWAENLPTFKDPRVDATTA